MQQVDAEQLKNESFYDEQNTFKWYCIINGADYTGIGHFKRGEMVKNEYGEEYMIGSDLINQEATKQRDLDVLNVILKNAPKGKKLRVLEMGSGRGGMSRTIAKGLLEKDLLELYVATNISDVENKYNAEQAKELGDKF